MTRYRPVDPNPDFSKIEEEILSFWEKERVFEKSLEQTKDRKPFTFYDGPPFATGLPHYGHILASTIKDLVPRFQTMQRRYVRRRWGWDCHGLPIEELVERELKISGKKQIEEIGIKTFVEKCRSFVLRYADEWGRTVRRIARWVEFENAYKTMDATYMESVWWAFKEIWKKGNIYEGRKVLLYCPRCETPISNFEVAMDNSYKNVEEEAVTVKFKVNGEENTYFLAWTTTPWTLPGNIALAVGEDIQYVRVKQGEETLIFAKERCLDVCGEDTQVLEEMSGRELVGLSYEPLFYIAELKNDKVFRVYSADFVTTEEGTGIVHTAVVYGEDDYNLGIKKGLPVVPLLDEKGIFNELAPEIIRGKYLKDAEPAIIEDLEKRNLLFSKAPHTHSYPFCWRCGTSLYYSAIPSWFVNVQPIKNELIKSNKKQVEWYPSHLKHGRYEKSVEAAPDWNISRNRYWGNPIPVWKCLDCDYIDVVGSLKELNEKRADEPATFFVMRHGEAQSNVGEYVSSYPELKQNGLTDIGRDTVSRAAQQLKNKEIVAIYSSDMQRTRETAEILSAELGIDVTYREDLREIDAGPFNGHPYSEYRNYLDFVETQHKKEPDRVESISLLTKRLVGAFRAIGEQHAGKNILIVSHGGPLYAAEAALSEGYFDLDVYKRSRLAAGEWRAFKAPNWSFNENGEVDLHRPYIDGIKLECQNCGGKMGRIDEIFDSWFEAAAMPFAEHHYPFENEKRFKKRYPAQFVAEYIAQTRAWFYTMHVMNLSLFGKAPFENVVTTGTILAEDGSKMSKSKGNFPDPWEVIEKYGADSLRFYLMNSVVMQADNLNFSERDLQNVHKKVFRILWNVYNYFVTYANDAGWEFREESSENERDQMSIIDRWIGVRLKDLISGAQQNLEDYSTVSYTRNIEAFVDDLSTWYVRRSRGRNDGAFFLTLYRVLFHLSQVLAPVAPFMAEHIYQNLKADDMPLSVHLTEWPDIGEVSSDDKKLLEEMSTARNIASDALSVRAKAEIKVRQKLSVVGSPRTASMRPGILELLKDEVNVEEVSASPSPSSNSEDTTSDVWLDTTLTPELRHEGHVREVVRAANALRKESGLVPQDRIVLYILGGDFSQDKDELLKATRADKIVFDKDTSVTSSKELKEGEETFWVGIKKV